MNMKLALYINAAFIRHPKANWLRTLCLPMGMRVASIRTCQRMVKKPMLMTRARCCLSATASTPSVPRGPNMQPTAPPVTTPQTEKVAVEPGLVAH